MNENLKNMIQGEFNRICVTNDVKELDDMTIHAVYNIIDLCKVRRKEIYIKQINGMGTASNVVYTDTDSVKTDANQMIKRLDNLHIETRPISPEQETKFLYYNMAVDDCLKVVRAYLESVAK